MSFTTEETANPENSVWVNVPSTACLSAQEVGGSNSVSDWFWKTLERSVGWNGKPTQLPTWRKRWKRTAWLQHLFGRISELSTADRGVARWIASLRATHAKDSQLLVNDVDRQIRDTFGPTSVESLAKLNPVSYFSKTYRIISTSVGKKSLPRWKAWVMTLRRASLLRRKLGHLIAESGSSSWASPNARGWKGRPSWKDQKSLPKDVENWLTPHEMAGLDHTGKRGAGGEFARQATRWTTPKSCPRGDRPAERIRRTPSLESQAKQQNWPTPSASLPQDQEDPETYLKRREQLRQDYQNGNGCGIPLTTASRLWPSPNCPRPHDSEDSAGRFLERENQPGLTGVACHFSLPDQTTCRFGKKCSPSTRRLSPLFVAYLMGWPRSVSIYSDFMEMEWFRWRQRMRSALCGLVCGLVRLVERDEAERKAA